MSDRTLQERGDLVMHIVADAIDGRSADAAAALVDLGATSTDTEMYGVCCGIAAVGVHCLQKIYDRQAADVVAGDMWALQELTPGTLGADPCAAFSLRFLIAYANQDGQTTLALFDAALDSDGDQYVTSVSKLLADVAGIARMALKPGPGEGQ